MWLKVLIVNHYFYYCVHRGSSKFCQRGPTLTYFFVVAVFFCLVFVLLLLFFISKCGARGPKYHLKQAIINLTCRPQIECWLGSFVIFRGSGPVLLKNPILFPGRGSRPSVTPSGSAINRCNRLGF